jgi:hypothetical protein
MKRTFIFAANIFCIYVSVGCGNLFPSKSNSRESFSPKDYALITDDLPNKWYCLTPGCPGHIYAGNGCGIDFFDALRQWAKPQTKGNYDE